MPRKKVDPKATVDAPPEGSVPMEPDTPVASKKPEEKTPLQRNPKDLGTWSRA